MRAISQLLKRKFAANPLYERCCFCNAHGTQWHHVLQYERRQLDEEYSILPACPDCHNDVGLDEKTRCYFEYISISLGLEDLQENYYKTDWCQRLSYIVDLLPRHYLEQAEDWINKL